MATSVTGGITAPLGIAAAGVHCGIKRSGLDLAIVAASDLERPMTAAALFTTNQVKAAPVLVSQAHMTANGGHARAVLINSGCANACTGDEGLAVAETTAAHAAFLLSVPTEQVLIASTGVIGVALDVGKVTEGATMAIDALAREGHLEAATAIMTTDRSPKEAAVETAIGSGTVRVGGMAKGAGMIEPHMATLLAVLTTDAEIDAPLLDRALRAACADTFNAITIDGDTSTNDSVFLLASGAAGVRVTEAELPIFQTALTQVCRELALAIVRGGEGVTRTVTVRVTGAAGAEDARRVAKTVANSLLVKTAIHGADPNWGRILAAAGRAGAPFNPARASVRIGPVLLYAQGRPHDDRASEAARFLARDEVEIEVGLGSGSGQATVYTCDLSAEYVRINGEYRT
jgi:glutamate N-acetyltransferase/amino-acid N-acetyltransferase